MKKKMTNYLYVDGERVLDATRWAREERLMLCDAKKLLVSRYAGRNVDFRVEPLRR
jgi:hypothetical protein